MSTFLRKQMTIQFQYPPESTYTWSLFSPVHLHKSLTMANSLSLSCSISFSLSFSCSFPLSLHVHFLSPHRFLSILLCLLLLASAISISQDPSLAFSFSNSHGYKSHHALTEVDDKQMLKKIASGESYRHSLGGPDLNHH